MLSRLREDPARIQVVAGPRQVGKTTMVRQVMHTVKKEGGIAFYNSADLPAPGDSSWIESCWNAAGVGSSGGKAILILDEVQKFPAGPKPSKVSGMEKRTGPDASRWCCWVPPRSSCRRV